MNASVEALWQGVVGRGAALGSHQYRRFWLGSMASVGASQLIVLGQGWLVFRLTGSPFDLGLLGLAASLPIVIVSFYGGALADRLDRRRVLAWTSAAIASLLLLLALLDYTERVALWHVLAIAALIGLLTGIDWPARQAIFPALIERRHMMSAVALNAILWQGSRMAMPAFGGVVIALGGTATIFVLAAIGFITMCAVVVRLQVVQDVGGQTSSAAGVMGGVLFIARTPLFATLIVLSWAISFFGVSYLQIMPAFVDLLGVSERGYGVLVSASGLGSVAGTVLLGSLHESKRVRTVFIATMILTATGLGLFGAVVQFSDRIPGAFGLSVACVVLIHVCVSAFFVTSMTVLQLEVPEALRGRVMGIHAINFSLIMFGGIFGGSVAATFDPPAAAFVGAGIIAGLAAVAGTHPRLRSALDYRASR